MKIKIFQVSDVLTGGEEMDCMEIEVYDKDGNKYAITDGKNGIELRVMHSLKITPRASNSIDLGVEK